ncbi:MAG: hypothetical protein O3B01_19285 [Planctomycetota bacterium]|nr:hypothetical protein [Planctomycetota bacterium]
MRYPFQWLLFTVSGACILSCWTMLSADSGPPKASPQEAPSKATGQAESGKVASSENSGKFSAEAVDAGGPQCSAGCAAAPSAGRTISDTEIVAHLTRLAGEETGSATPSMETLLFYRKEVVNWVGVHGTTPLDEARAEFLKKELERGMRARVHFRIVDSEGACRIELEAEVPIGEKQHLHPAAAIDVTPPEFSFTVRRVGLHHLWTRL